MSDAADRYASLVQAMEDQRTRTGLEAGINRWDPILSRFRFDPRRQLEDNLQTIASYLSPEDVLIDVGGGAGSCGLPLALRCREVINVEPSEGMRREFEASAREAGISNARLVPTDWLSAGDVKGDVSLVKDVTYFVRDIVPFVERLTAASRRLVIVANISIPVPNQSAKIFRALHGEDQAPVPGHQELLPVLWDLGLLPDVRVLGPEPVRFPSRENAIEVTVAQNQTDSLREDARRTIEAHFDDGFEPRPGGFAWRTPSEPRMILITWATK